MKKLMILFFGLFFTVAGFSIEGERNDGFCVEDVCAEMEFNGGETSIIQGHNDIEVVVTENIGYDGSITVTDAFNKVIFYEYFEDNALIVVDISNYSTGDYRLVATAGTNVTSLIFSVR